MSRTATATHRTAGPRRVAPWKAAGVAAAIGLLLAACGSEAKLEGKVVKDGLGCSLTETDRKTGDVPEIAESTKVAKEVGKKDLTKGKGCVADGTGYLTLDIVGATAADGKVFRNTFEDDGQPLTARLGQGQLLPGLETGLDGLKVGGRRLITVPADQAYGADGDETLGIGKDAALVFVVDLVGVTDTPLYCNPALPIDPAPEGGAKDKPTEVDLPKAPVEKLKTTDLVEGKGEAATKTSYVTVQYLGVACSTGKVFDTSWDRGEPLPVTLGSGGVIAGFDNGIVGMKVGGRRQIDIPAAEAYGAAGSEPNIGPNDPLTFIIELVTVADEAPTTTTAPVETTTTVAGETTTTVAGDTTTTTAAGDGSTTTTAVDDATTTTAPDDETTTTTTEG